MDLIASLKDVIAPWVKARVNARSELGASLVEYALLVALIAVVCIVSITFLGNQANNEFSEIGSKIG